MANAGSLDYFIRSIWQGGPGVKEASTAIGGLGQTAKKTDVELAMARQNTAKYQSEVRNMAKEVRGGSLSMEAAEAKAAALRQELGIGETQTKKSGLRFTELQAKISLAQQAFSAVQGVAQKTWQIIGEGAQLELAENRFDRLTAKIGTTSDALLNDFGKATGGMLSNADMIASASQIIELGLADTSEDVVRLGNVIGQLGLDSQQIIMTFANDSKMRLDALGLSVTDVEKRTKAYEEQGIAATKAFDMAVLDALEARLETLGSAVGTTAGNVATLEAQWKNMTDAGKQWMAGRWTGILGGVSEIISIQSEKMGQLNALYESGAISTAEYRAGQMGVLMLSGEMNDAIEAEVATNKAYLSTLEAVSADMVLMQTARSIETAAMVAAEQATAAYTTSLGSATSMEGMYAAAAQESGMSAINSYRARQESLENYSLSLSESYGLQQMYGEAAQLSATQSNNASLQLQHAQEVQSTYNAALLESFTTLSQNEEALASYTTIMAGVQTHSVLVSGATAEQTAELERLQGIYDKAGGVIRDYEQGLKGVTLSDEARNEKIAEQETLMVNAQAAMAPLIGIQSEYATVTDGGAEATQLLNEKIYAQIQASTDNVYALAIAGQELGIFTEAQAQAMLKAALLEEQIRKQAEAWDGTAAGLQTMQTNIQGYIDVLNATPDVITTTFVANTQGSPPPWAGAGASTDTGESHGQWGGEVDMASGGVVSGGVWGQDSVPAMLMPGERVLTVSQNRAFESGQMGGGGGDSYTIYTQDNTAAVVQQLRARSRMNVLTGGM